MNQIDNILLEKYNVRRRLVEITDASFILSLRLDKRRGRFLSLTENSLVKQEEWITSYKKKEARGEEFYFIYEHVNGTPYGVNRIYNILPNSFEIGSWLFSLDSPEGLSVLADLCCRDFAFDKWKYLCCHFEVRKGNKTVINYHRRFRPELIGEDELNYYFCLSREHYVEYRDKLLKYYLNGTK